jgi:hypothetical protein
MLIKHLMVEGCKELVECSFLKLTQYNQVTVLSEWFMRKVRIIMVTGKILVV